MDSEGMSLYLFTPDEEAEGSTCAETCAERWPPLLTEGEPAAGSDAVDASLLGTVEREDGSMQVTYNDWPLYTFFQDEEPGDIEGQGIESFGGEWYLVSPAGTEQEAEADEGEAETVENQHQRFQVAVASYLTDTAGLHAIDERLNEEGGEIDPGDLGTVRGIHRVVQATDWPEPLQEGADELVATLVDLAQVLSDQNLEAAAPLALMSTRSSTISPTPSVLVGGRRSCT